ncbi:tRNA pseudouridine(55) synthase TruB [Sebaldella sp. S0638]|uniref:tRNA pseudouridine(55) synthase TruB n=1 Tax=Sebaldella sp. S0638 TaxID=2957809 RepID=UPI0020A0311C|nr:tRNA pseudouridine(55) synthase TruB [Sebaldella sp. S0638]MCP1225282.1 tRNA pseudouridine(55) synthase TruB [Sebaldella sp. S0638]
MDGIILLNKEKDISSFKAINHLKYKLKLKKVGHAGTLDPLAEGLMIVLVNDATKLSDMLLKQSKEYYAECELGYETDSYDCTGVKTQVYEGKITVDREKIINTLEGFQGDYEQTPPMYSAIKVNGKKLYDLARKGIEIERKTKVVNIGYINRISVEGNKVGFYIHAGSGTYIRSVIQDFGRRLGTYATMTKLIRTKIGKFSLENAYREKEIENESVVMKAEDIFDFPVLHISDEEYFKMKNGIKLNKDITDGHYSIYNNGEYKGIGISEGGILKRFRYFNG